MSTIVVLAGGDGPRPLPSLPSPDCVIAADSGLALAMPLGLTPDLVIGDMDSVDPDLLSAAAENGATVERHSIDKDATDLELAMEAAMTRGAERIIVVGGGGGRLDHLLANTALIAADRYRDAIIEWFVDDYLVAVVRATHRLSGTPGDLVTLLAIADHTVVTTSGLRWPLDGDELMPGSTRGVSNELTAETAIVTVDGGTAIVLHRRSA